MSKLIDRLRGVARRTQVVAVLVVLVLAGAIVATAVPPGTNKSARVASKTSARAVAPHSEALQLNGIGYGTGAATSADAVATASDANGGTATASVAPAPPPMPPVATGNGSGLVPDPGAHVVRTATIAIEVKRHRGGRTFDRVTAIAAEMGGYVAASTRSSGDEAGGQLSIRVPAARFEEARRALAALGKVTNEQLRGVDVGGQIVDLDARLKSLQAEEATLRTLVAQAKTVGDVMQVQPQLFDVRRQIEQLQAQHAQLDQQTAYSTFDVSVSEAGAPIEHEPKPEPVLARSVKTAAHATLSVLGGILIVLGALVPFVVIGGIVLLVLRVRRRSDVLPVPATDLPS